LEDLDRLMALHERLQVHHESVEPRIWRPEFYAMAQRRSIHDENIRSANGAVYVAEEGDEIVGFLSGRVEEREGTTPGVVGYVQTAYIGEEWRGRGVGTALVARLFEFFESKGVEEASVRYVLANRGAAQFWEGFGFLPMVCTANARLSELRLRLAERSERAERRRKEDKG